MRLAQLLRVRPVLGVVDRDEFTAREGQREGERLRLGARSARRDDDDFERRPADGALGRDDGRRVVRLEQQLDVEAIARPVRYYGANATRAGLSRPAKP